MNNMIKAYLSIMVLLSLALSAGAQGADKTGEVVLKIGSPNVVKSANLLGDSSLGVFAHLTNPPLMKMDGDGNVAGQIADSYEVSSDGKTWKFHIRDNLTWSDGEKFTPGDVKFTLDYLKDNYPQAGWMEEVIEESSLADDNSVVLKLGKPYSRLNLEFATYLTLPEHIWKKIENPMEYTNEGEVVGLGPFYIEKTDLASGTIYMRKNPYWNGTKPEVDSIEIHMYANMDVLSLALQKGDMDAYYKYAGTYPYANVKSLEDTGKFEFTETQNTGLVFLGMNLKNAPMSDLSFREALSYAINYSEILNLDALGYGSVPNRGFIPPSMSNFKDTPELGYNISRAKEILALAGYKDSNGNGILEGQDGKDIKLVLLTRSDYLRITELLTEYLKAAGIDSETKMVDSSTWIKLKDEYGYDLTIARTTPWGMMMHANWGTGYFDSRRTGEGVLHVLDDTEFQNLCDGILSATNEDQMKDYAYDVQDYYAKNLPGIALYWNKVLTPYNKEFTGWSSDPLYGIYNLDSFLNVKRASS